jgi:Na+/phosphate symporter
LLLGIHHLTEGLKGLAGDALRRTLQAMVSGKLSAIVSGALFTGLIQSSTATTLTVIGFVSAGLVTFAQAVGVIIGAIFGTTSTPWLVAIFGFRLRISAFALPMLGIGAFLWIIAKGKTRSGGAILAGFGLLSSASTTCRREWRGFVEPRCHWWTRFRLAMDPRWNRNLDVDCDAEFECSGGGYTRGRACGVADL